MAGADSHPLSLPPPVARCSRQRRALPGPADRLRLLLRGDNGGGARDEQPPARLLRQEEPGRQRHALGKGQRLSRFHAQIPNKKFPVAKLLYLEGHF